MQHGAKIGTTTLLFPFNDRIHDYLAITKRKDVVTSPAPMPRSSTRMKALSMIRKEYVSMHYTTGIVHLVLANQPLPHIRSVHKGTCVRCIQIVEVNINLGIKPSYHIYVTGASSPTTDVAHIRHMNCHMCIVTIGSA